MLLVKVLLLIALFGFCGAYEPMVAFLCNKPSMYLTKKGWKRDLNTNCIKDPVEILNYCKKVFPEYNITNILHGHETEINGWCGFRSTSCKKYGAHKVIPYRCLVGPFQTDALLVPEHCTFDHLYDPERCLPERDWAEIARSACKQAGKVTQSWAMLMPCAVGRYDGVEHVCCPRPRKDKNKFKLPTDNKLIYQNNHPKNMLTPHHNVNKPKKLKANAKKVELYFLNRLQTPDVDDEHEHYMTALEAHKELEHEKKNRVMRKWRNEVKKIDDHHDSQTTKKKAQQLAKKYELEYHNIEENGELRRKSLDNVHLKRIQEHFNRKKRDAMGDYLNAIEAADAHEVLKTLERYIRIEEKDKMHSLNHYLHVRQIHPAEASRIRDRTLNHVTLVDKRINESLKMLSKLEKHEAKQIEREILTFMQAYKAMDKNGELKILNQALPTEEPKGKAKDNLNSKQFPRTIPEHEPKRNNFIQNENEKYNAYTPKHPLHEDKLKSKIYSEKTKEESDDLAIEMHSFLGSAGTVFLILAALLTILLAVMVCFICLRRRQVFYRLKEKKSFSDEKCPDKTSQMSPEEYNIYKMQQHGYINPTWAYLENKTGSQDPLIA